MGIIYKELKDLPNKKLHELFVGVGWSDGQEDGFLLNNFNVPFHNSTLVFSAWDDDKLVGCVRVLSDKIVRSVIQDLAVLPDYQNRGIGTELLKKCVEVYPKSEWLVPTVEEKVPFYEKNGFQRNDGVFMSIPSRWF